MQELPSYIQWGFAGFAFLLLTVLVWVLKLFIHTNREIHQDHVKLTQNTTTIVERNTAVIENLHGNLTTQSHQLERLADELKSRPCIAKSTQ